jgi:alkanesulfonate monooxygenase SsuD/methylene tetrahydromethanopterin reductase-like flavin-dependent oxidoreductase (luciferase family)
VTIVDVQFSPAHCEWAELRDACLAADAGPFGALWVYDHLAGTTLSGGHTNLECFALLGALAELTERIELGSLVANVWNRQVGTMVTAAASVALIARRQFHLGIGAGTSPRSKFAREQLAVAAHIADPLEERHRRVEEVLDVTQRMWSPDRDEAFAGFPLPSPTPTRIVGANSVHLSVIAGRGADGINVPWHQPWRDECLAAASAEAARLGRPFVRTVWTYFDEALIDPDHPERARMRDLGIDRLVLAELGRPPSATQLTGR